MSVDTTLRVKEYDGDGLAFDFAIPFRFLSNDHLVVTLLTLGIGEAQTLNTDYTLVGVGSDAGGTLTMELRAPIVGEVLRIARIVPAIQQYRYTSIGNVFPETVESSLDYAMMLAQQNSDSANGFSSMVVTTAELNALTISGGEYYHRVACVRDTGVPEVFKINVLEADGVTYSWQVLFTSPA